MKQLIIFGLIIFLSLAFTINALAVEEIPQPVRAQKRALEPAAANVVAEDPIAETEPISSPPLPGPPPPASTLYMDEDMPADTPAVGVKKGEVKSQAKSENKRKGQTQRSRVANAVQKLLDAADREGGIGKQVRVIAQNQNKRQERAEAALSEAKKRGGFMKFIIGPNYKQLEKAKAELQAQNQELGQLRGLLDQVSGASDEAAIAEQIAVLEQVKNEVAAEVGREIRGFSLFGWLNKIMSGYK